jgi:hypothetical protein
MCYLTSYLSHAHTEEREIDRGIKALAGIIFKLTDFMVYKIIIITH